MIIVLGLHTQQGFGDAQGDPAHMHDLKRCSLGKYRGTTMAVVLELGGTANGQAMAFLSRSVRLERSLT